jgi:molybdopterin synthase sulfur carrier subunit
MPIRVRVPTPLRRFTAGNDEVSARGDSIKAVIQDLEQSHPGISERLLDEKGELRRFVNIYLNGDDIRFLSQLDSKVKDGDDISIVPAIAGGIAR